MYAHMVTLMAEMETTWDGLPVARERPYACAVVVWREIDGRREFLLLHRLAPGVVSPCSAATFQIEVS